jgi:hypothetical protein
MVGAAISHWSLRKYKQVFTGNLVLLLASLSWPSAGSDLKRQTRGVAPPTEPAGRALTSDRAVSSDL